MKRPTLIVTFVAASLLLAACAPDVNGLVHTANAQGLTAGFWRGLWHGIIAPVTFIISLFSDKVGVYELHNNGGWYNFGFLLGLVSLHGGKAAHSVARRRSSKWVVTIRRRREAKIDEPDEPASS